MLIYPRASVSLHSMLNGCDWETVESHDYFWDGQMRGAQPFCFWQYTISGEGAFRIKGYDYSLKPGKALLGIIPEEHVYYLPKRSDKWEFIYLNFTGSEAIRLFNSARKNGGVVQKYDIDSEPVVKAFDIYDECCTGKISDCYKASAVAYDFVTTLCSYAGNNEEVSKEIDFVKRVHKFCLANLGETIYLDDLAGVAGFSKYHFTRRFKEVEGVSPMEYLLSLRLNMALRLLQNDTQNVKSIALCCGFKDVSYFCKAFRERYGQTPGSFRNSC
ncbi:MAG: helix-turn-helix transcriptional regulator [Lentisphaerae bacterium]|nr:helix-turn-helix transcriptional regulator [Lentisphaerota bacterium]MCP4102022.1 helix-turn-helix transcriptional regulator [Lentisphaerota bacterium]